MMKDVFYRDLITNPKKKKKWNSIYRQETFASYLFAWVAKHTLMVHFIRRQANKKVYNYFPRV